MIRLASGAFVLALALVAPAWAQGDIEGIVTKIEPANNTVHLKDGRIVYIKPGSTIMLDGRPVTFADIQPGVMLVVRAGAGDDATSRGARMAGPPSAVTSTTSSAAVMMPSHPPVDTTGVVARVDRAANVIVFQDGRALKVAGGRVWQSTNLDAVHPGQTVFLDNAQPLAFSAPVQGGVPSRPVNVRQQRLGTIGQIDRARNVVVLNDGTIVRLIPTAKLSKQGRTIDLSQMQPGDEIVIWLAPPRMAADASRTTAREYTGSASPADDAYPYASIESDEILVVRPHVQAP